MKKVLEEPIHFKYQSHIFADSLHRIKRFTENRFISYTVYLNYMLHVPR